jgi:hypothetical protein
VPVQAIGFVARISAINAFGCPASSIISHPEYKSVYIIAISSFASDLKQLGRSPKA